jgi:hypothetical protein
MLVLILSRLPPLPERARVIVGLRSFDVEQDLLSSVSPFFQKAFQGPWIEAGTRTITLTDTDPETFAHFLEWLRSNEATTVKNQPSSNYFPDSYKDLPDRSLDKELRLMPLLRLWVLSDVLQTSSLQNDAMKLIANKYHNYDGKNIFTDVFDYVYENTPPRSALRRILVDFASYKMTYEFYEQNRTNLHGDFLEDLCSVFINLNRGFAAVDQKEGLIFAGMYYVPSEISAAGRTGDEQKTKSTEQKRRKQLDNAAQLATRKILKPKLRKPQKYSQPTEL